MVSTKTARCQFLIVLTLSVFLQVEIVNSSLIKNQLPHIILIIADDLGYNDVSFHGSQQIPTPNLDLLAYSGVILNSYYVSPICTPSRSALFTGKHPVHTGMQHNVIYGTTPYGLPLEEKLLPQYLKDLNYSTHLVGKWHLGHFRRAYTPTCRGFDSHFGHWTGHKDYYDNMAEESGPSAWGYDHRRNFEVSYECWGDYTTDVYTNEAIDIIRNHSQDKNGSPLFLTLSHTAVHSANPYKLLQAPEEDVNKFAHIKDPARRTYAAMVHKLDESVGKVMQALARESMLENSIVIFTTDNGGPAAGFNGNAASNWPLRGVKNTLYEGGVRGVGFIWSPLLKSTPRVSTQMMHIQDWLPTILGAVGTTIPDKLSGKLDGVNLWTTLNDPDIPSPRTEFLHNIDDSYGNEAVRHNEWKLMHGTTYGGKWDNWYGPSGFEPESQSGVKINSLPTIENSTIYDQILSSYSAEAVKSLQIGTITLPNVSTMMKLLNESRIVCEAPRPKENSCELKSGQYCLFNIIKDPCEYTNLASNLPQVVDQLKVIEHRTSYFCEWQTKPKIHSQTKGEMSHSQEVRSSSYEVKGRNGKAVTSFFRQPIKNAVLHHK
ncbi:unnamed protein product [Allacma fusca]|uniref:Sulfatase N-terminal domain-containing protein n=1 Tax=Allacma fusca TaxID=39272 RepID=A0A8J2PRU8_9HEXA|nr:unnamed protein product [Allacma fusca]